MTIKLHTAGDLLTLCPKSDVGGPGRRKIGDRLQLDRSWGAAGVGEGGGNLGDRDPEGGPRDPPSLPPLMGWDWNLREWSEKDRRVADPEGLGSLSQGFLRREEEEGTLRVWGNPIGNDPSRSLDG